MAGLLRPLSLRARLSLLVGFIVAVVVSAAAFLELRMFERTLASELLDAARRTALAVADDLELRSRTPDVDDNPSAALHQFLEVNPAVRRDHRGRISTGTTPVSSPAPRPRSVRSR